MKPEFRYLSEEEYQTILNKIDSVITEVSLLNRKRDIGNTWVDNEEACEILKISTRTLQDLRDNKVIPCSRRKKKIYYKRSDIELYLEKGYNGKKND